MKNILKKIGFSILPNFLLHRMRRSHYLQKLANASILEEKDLAALPLLVKKGDTVLDIGANFGLYTRFLSEAVGAGGKVHSFEPLPPVFDYLHNNIFRLELENVQPWPLALSGQNGQALMEVPKYDSGGDNFYEAHLTSSASGKNVHKVKTRTLDAFVEEQKIIPSFIKIDVEGHELEVLKAAEKTLQNHRPKLMVEVNDDPAKEGGNGAQVFEFLTGLGYRPHIFTGKELKPWKGERVVNYFFV